MSFSSNTADKMVNMVPDVIDKISGLVSGSSKKDAKEKKDKDKE